MYKTYDLVATAFPKVAKTLFQALNMPDSSWNPKGLAIPLRRPFEIFIPNVCAVDMDTSGTWPFGRRLEDQVATRFLSMFLDMEAEFKARSIMSICSGSGFVGQRADCSKDSSESAEE